MNLTIERELLLENLTVISKGLPVKTPMPILTGIKFYVTDTDLFMTSSNSDISVEVTISSDDSRLEILAPGQTIVPGKLFIDIIRKINSKKVNLYLSDDKILMIKSDRSEFQLHVMNYLDYPKVSFVSQDNPLELDSELIKEIVRETVFATATSEKKPILTGVNFNNIDNRIVITATDSFRLSQKIITITEYKDFNITIPAKSLEELAKAVDNYGDKIKLYFSTNKMLVVFKNVCFQTRLLDGNYPQTSALIPTSFPIILKFNKDELLQAVDRVSVISPRDKVSDKELTYSIIKLSLKRDRIVEISTSNVSQGKAVEQIIPTDIITNNPITIGFSARYLIDSLRSLMSQEVSINIISEVKPFIIRGDNDANLTELILPVRMDS